MDKYYNYYKELMHKHRIIVDNYKKTKKRLNDAKKILFSIRSDSNPSYLVKLIEEYKEKHGINK